MEGEEAAVAERDSFTDAVSLNAVLGVAELLTEPEPLLPPELDREPEAEGVAATVLCLKEGVLEMNALEERLAGAEGVALTEGEPEELMLTVSVTVPTALCVAAAAVPLPQLLPSAEIEMLLEEVGETRALALWATDKLRLRETVGLTLGESSPEAVPLDMALLLPELPSEEEELLLPEG